MDEKLQKSVDDSLQTMTELLKAKKEDKETLKELLKNPKHREMVRDLMKEHQESESEEESEEEGDSADANATADASTSETESEDENDEKGEKCKGKGEKMKGKGDGDSEEEEMKGEKMDSSTEFEEKPKAVGKRLKKSHDDFAEVSEGIIDAVPVLKSLAGVLADAVEEIAMLKSEISELKSSQDEMSKMTKSFGDVLTAEVNLVKSLTEETDKLGKQPQKVKGHIGNKADILEKSFTDGEGKQKSYNIPQVREVLMKSYQEGKVSALSIGKWEQSRYDMNVFSPTEIAVIDNGLK